MADVLVERAREAINKVHSDTSVSPERTKARLQDLKDHLEILIDAIDSGIRGLEA